MKKEVVACDYVFRSSLGGVLEQQCQTFASMTCTFCGKDFCPAHTAGLFGVAIASIPSMSVPTSSAPAAPFFDAQRYDRAVPICQECGRLLSAVHTLLDVGDILQKFLAESIEAEKAAIATRALTKDKRA